MRLQKLLPLLAAAVLAGCGADTSSSGGDSGRDPAAALPADVPLYVEAVVRPEGEQADNARELLSRFLGDKSLEDLIDEGLADEDKTYADDIEPWLGARAAFGVMDLSGADPAYVAAVQVTDEDAAKAAFDDPKEVGTHAGVTVYQDEDDDFEAISDGLLLVSTTRPLVEAAIDRSDDDSLASDERFQDAIDGLPEERLGAFYLDLSAFGKIAAAASGDPAAAAVLDQFFGEDAAPVTAALTARPDAATIESRLAKSALESFGPFASSTAPELVADAPAGSFAVLGYTDVGAGLKSTIDLFGGALGGAALKGQLESQTGVNLDRDVFSWVGDIALFVRGDTVQKLDGALVIEETDAKAAAAGIARLVAIAKRTDPVRPVQVEGAEKAFSLPVPDLPAPLVVAYDDEHAVFAVGEQAAADALNPTETIADSGIYDRAEEAVDGISPSAIVDIGAILALAEADGATSDPSFQEAKPYLDELDLLVTGAEEEGDDLRSLFTVSVKGS